MAPFCRLSALRKARVAAAAKAMLVGAHAGELADDLLQFVRARPVGAMIVEF